MKYATGMSAPQGPAHPPARGGGRGLSAEPGIEGLPEGGGHDRGDDGGAETDSLQGQGVGKVGG